MKVCEREHNARHVSGTQIESETTVGLFVVPIFYPVVPMNSPRSRITLIATLTVDDIEQSLRILEQAGREAGG